ncbi:MAG: hypothetical protein QXR69_01715 [Conexivisphaerales archaeon]
MPRKSAKKTNSEKTKDPKPIKEQAKENEEKKEAPVQQQSEPQKQVTEEQRRSVPPNHIFVGKKPVMGYALSAVMQLTQYDTVVLRARGRAISTAVDVAQVVIKRLGTGQFESKSITIGTETIGEGAEARNVSTIEIVIGKK